MRMKISPLALVFLLISGCARDDARLHGTWRSNRDATVAAAFERDPRWKTAPPEKVAGFRELFGRMRVTYSKRTATSDYRGEASRFGYRVVKSGPDFVVIRMDTPHDQERDIRIRFVDGGSSYWIESGSLGNGIEERFDRVAR